jgi:hypothetical protein
MILDAYLEFLGNLSAARLGELARLTTEDVRFEDPFQKLHGRAAYERCLRQTLHDVAGLAFDVTHVGELAPRHPGDAALYAIRWNFSGALPRVKLPVWSVTGMSEIHCRDGRVAAHVDHWDAAGGLYEHLPALGFVLRHVRRKIAA